MKLYDVYRETTSSTDALYADDRPMVGLPLADALRAARAESDEDLDAWFTVTKALPPIEIWDDLEALIRDNLVKIYMHGTGPWTQMGAMGVQLTHAEYTAVS